MSRSATDATRFTSTTPHASAKIPLSGSRSGSSPQSTPGAPGETPQQKVRRLRAAADAARLAQISTFDKLIIVGRVWADRAHRFTTLTLIGASFIAAGFSLYAVGDMMIYNRRKRADFFVEKKARYEAAVSTAKTAIRAGNATEAQLAFMERLSSEDARIEALEAEKAQKKGFIKRGTEWLFSGLKKEEQGDGEIDREASSDRDTSGRVGNSLSGKVIQDTMALEGRAREAFASQKEKQQIGGPLDRLGTTADNTTEAPKSGGWMSFWARKS